MTSSARFFGFALGTGLLVRLYLLWLAAMDPAILMHSDQLDYIRLANLVNLSGLGTPFGAERVPGYPLFLAACSWLAPGGKPISETFGVSALLLAVFVQNCLGLTVIFFLYRIGGLINQTTANLAGGFAALNLNMAIYSSQILTDALFYPLFAGCLCLFFQYRDSGSKRHLMLMTVLLGLATLVRPVTMYLPLIVVLYLLFGSKGIAPVERGKRVLLFVAVFAALLSPWLARNAVLYGHAVITNQGQGHIVGWVIPGIIQYEEGIDLGSATAESGRRWREHLSFLPPAARTDPFLLDAEAKKWFGEYLRTVSPSSVVKAWFWGAIKNIFAPVSIEVSYIFQMDWTHFYDTPGVSFPEQAINFVFHNFVKNRVYAWLLLSGIVLTLFFRVVQLFGAFLLFRERFDFLMINILVIAYFLAVSGPVGYAKYRLPYELVFVLLTAMAVGALPWFRREVEKQTSLGVQRMVSASKLTSLRGLIRQKSLNFKLTE